MSMPWEDAAGDVQQVPAELFNKEKNLSAMTAGPGFQQEEQDWVQNSVGANSEDLDKAIKEAKTPWHEATLQKTKEDFEAIKTKPTESTHETMPWEDARQDITKPKVQEDYPDQVSRTATRHPTGMWDKYVEQPLGKLDNGDRYLASRIEAAGGAVKGFGEALASGAGMAKSLVGSALDGNTGTRMKDALATGERWATALNDVLPEGLQKVLSTPSADAGVSLSTVPVAPLLEGIDALRNAGHEDLADAATLALGIGGAAAAVAGVRGGKAAKVKAVEAAKTPEAAAVESMLPKGPDLSKPLEFTKPEKPELTASSEYDLSQPPKSAVYGEYAAPTLEPVGNPKYEGGIDYYPDNPTKYQDAHKIDQIEAAWDEHAKAQEKDNQTYADKVKPYMGEDFQPAQSSSILEKGPTRKLNNRQGGKIDPELLGVNAIMKVVDYVKSKFPSDINKAGDAFLDKYRGTFRPEAIEELKANKSQIVMMTPEEFHKAAMKRGRDVESEISGKQHDVAAALETKDGLYTSPTLEVFHDGDKWVVSGHNGRHRMDVFKMKGLDLIPVRIMMDGATRQLWKPSDFVKSKDTHFMSENGEVITKPRSLASYFAENRPSPMGGVGKKQGGALNMGAFFGKEKATQGDFQFSQETVRELVTKSLLRSVDFDAFVQDLKMVQSGPNWMGEVVGKAEQLWANRNTIVSQMPQSQFSKMSRLDQKQSMDMRPFEQFAKEELPHNEKGELQPIPRGQDIGAFGDALNTASRASQANYDTLGGKWMKWIISNTQELSNQGNKLFKEMKGMVEGFEKLDRKGRLNITNAATKFDGILNNKLTELGLQWPTRDMLREQGLKPAEIEAYLSEAKAVDRGWDLLGQIYKAMGKEPPARIPGYFPRFWEGSWKVEVRSPEGQLVAIRPFNTSVSAKMFGRAGLDEGMKTEIIRPSTDVQTMNMVSTLAQASRDYNGKSSLGKAMVTMLARMEESSSRGIITEALKREGIKGYSGEEGIKDNLFSRNADSKLAATYIRYFEDISNFWSNSRIASEVAAPFLDAAQQQHFVNAPNTLRAIESFIARATGHPINRVAQFQHFSRELAVSMGLPPEFVGNSISSASHSMSALMLKYNPTFWAINYLQPLLVWPKIVELHIARLNESGTKVGSPISAMNTFIREFASLETGKSSPKLEKAKAWGKENGVIDVIQADHINPSKQYAEAKIHETLSEKPTRSIEERGRTVTFLALYSYFEKVMPDHQALRAAALHTDDVMGNYNTMNIPGMYTDYGTIGRTTRPFALLTNTYLGNQITAINMVAKSIGDAVKDPKMAPKIVTSLIPLAGWMGFYYAMGGIPAMMGAKEWDVIAKTFNTLINPDSPLPESGEYLRQNEASEVTKYGMLGSALGINIGPSVGSPAFTQLGAAPGLQFAKSAAQLTWAAINRYTGGTPNMDSVRQASSAIAPPYARPWLDEKFAARPGLVPGATSLDATVERTSKEDSIYKATGKKAITEVERDTQDKILGRVELTNKEWKKQMVNKIITAEQLKIGDPAKLIQQALEAKRGFDAETLKADMAAERQRRILKKDLQNIDRIKSGSNKAQQGWEMEQYNKLRR